MGFMVGQCPREVKHRLRLDCVSFCRLSKTMLMLMTVRWKIKPAAHDKWRPAIVPSVEHCQFLSHGFMFSAMTNPIFSFPGLQHLSFPRSTARWWTSSTTARTAPRTTSADCSRPNNITWKSSKNAMTKVEKFIDRLWTEISKLPKFLAGLETYRNRTNQKIWSTEFSSGSHRVCEIHICYLWLQYIFILFIKTKNQPS